jgi:molybdopterin biosynthesis enzyme
VIASEIDRCNLWAKQMHPEPRWMTHGRFTERLSLVDAWAWLDTCPDAMGSEAAPLDHGFGRVLAAPLTFPADRPERDLALVDGHAVHAESTLGASTYNPLFLTTVPNGMALAAGCASVCHAGETLPSGADAVLPMELGEAVGTALEVCDAVPPGFGVGRKGHAARHGEVAIEAGRRLGVPQIALAASLGATQLIGFCRKVDFLLRIRNVNPLNITRLLVSASAVNRTLRPGFPNKPAGAVWSG